MIEAAPARDELGVGIQTNRTADPTASKGIQLVEHYRLRRIVETCKAIERALDQMPPECRRLVELTYWRSDLSAIACANELHMAHSTYRGWKSRVIHFVAYHFGLSKQIVALKH